MFNPTWLNPPDFLGAAKAGAELGLQQQKQAQEAVDAANELNARRQESADRLAQAKSEQDAHSQDEDAARALTERMGLGRLQLGQERLSTMDENSDASRALRDKLGQERINLIGTGKPARLDPITQAKLGVVTAKIKSLQNGLTKNAWNPLAVSTLTPQLASANREMEDLLASAQPQAPAPTASADLLRSGSGLDSIIGRSGLSASNGYIGADSNGVSGNAFNPKIQGNGSVASPTTTGGFISSPSAAAQLTQTGNLPTTNPAAPKPGDVMQGYRFKGGDPGTQSNWEPVQ